MFESDGFKNFLLAIDVFSSKVFAVPLKSKSSEETAAALKTIFNKFGTTITKIESDQGSEFKKVVKDLFRKKKIVFKYKFGKNKSAIIEHYIYLVKRRLFMLLRGTLSKNWVSQLPKICDSFNNTPLKRLGWLKPNDINTLIDAVRVNEAKKKFGIPVLSEPSFKEQQENQISYENNKKNLYQANQFCYVDMNSSVFDKAYDVSVFNRLCSKLSHCFLS